MAQAPGRHTLEIETQLVGTVVRPGDKLIIAVRHRLSMAEADDATKFFESHLPGVDVVFVDDVAGLAVYREDKGSIHHPDNPHHHLLDVAAGQEGATS